MSDNPFATEIQEFMRELKLRNPNEPEFHQAVHEVVETIYPFIHENQKYRDAAILERLTEPDRVIVFRVTWDDDHGKTHVNRAFRVQFNNSIGPYKGGLRFTKSVNLSILKFLGFEQTFKNSLTGLPMGGAKGGADFSPKGKSNAEIMRFCQSLMVELHRHIGEDTDVPAGDIGVGAREIGYLVGHYRRMENRFTGILTGKGLSFGGSDIRVEATGWGAVYFLEDMLNEHGHGLGGLKCAVSGSGNVALYCMQKLNQLGAIPVTASDSSGTVHDPDGITGEKWEWLRELKEERRGRVHEYAENFGCEYHEGASPWSVNCDIALPCATQNELDGDDAKLLVKNKIIGVAEGANMPCTEAALTVFKEAGVLVAPGKAANAGGVAVSGLELSQNALRINWSRGEVDARLRKIMSDIHRKCVQHGKNGELVDYIQGANIGGFVKVAEAMMAYGTV
ncbi:MAG: NADP-specific glutamate dehydrogenase [Verrucomicrobiota bacterium]